MTTTDAISTKKNSSEMRISANSDRSRKTSDAVISKWMRVALLLSDVIISHEYKKPALFSKFI